MQVFLHNYFSENLHFYIDIINYTDDRFERVSDRRFYEENHLPIPDSLKKAEERTQQKKELEALKKKIESKLAENSSLSQGKGRQNIDTI